MEILEETKLDSGELLRVLHWCSPEKAPRKYADYIAAAWGAEDPHLGQAFYTLNGWRGYFRDAMQGKYFPDVTDHWFFAEIDGECAGRIWFAYSARSRRGNFGNVRTEPQYRRRGIMNVLMKHCMAEIRRSPVRTLCCSTTNKFAAETYLKHGFHLIYGGETGPLCFSGEGPFLEQTKRAFAGSRIAEIRPGGIGDQFDCDKFLAYVPEIYRRELPVSTGPAALVNEYRLAYQEQIGGRSVVHVALNEQRECCGYAFAVMLAGGVAALDFMVHPAYLADAPRLIRAAAEAFRAKFGIPPVYYGLAADTEKNTVLREAGMAKTGGAAGCLTIRDRPADMTVMQFRTDI